MSSYDCLCTYQYVSYASSASLTTTVFNALDVDSASATTAKSQDASKSLQIWQNPIELILFRWKLQEGSWRREGVWNWCHQWFWLIAIYLPICKLYHFVESCKKGREEKMFEFGGTDHSVWLLFLCTNHYVRYTTSLKERNVYGNISQQQSFSLTLLSNDGIVHKQS